MKPVAFRFRFEINARNKCKMPLIPSNYTTTHSKLALDDDFPSYSSTHSRLSVSSSRLPPPFPSSLRKTRRASSVNLSRFADERDFRPQKYLTVNDVISPRRIFPQVNRPHMPPEDNDRREESPVVFGANLSFVLGCKGKLRQNMTPIPAHLEEATASSYLSNKISNFLRRTDHVMDEWRHLGHKDEAESLSGLGRSKSATNIMIKGFRYYSRASSCRSSVARDFSEDRTEAEADEVYLRSCRNNT